SLGRYLAAAAFAGVLGLMAGVQNAAADETSTQEASSQKASPKEATSQESTRSEASSGKLSKERRDALAKQLAPYYQPPQEFAGDLSTYASPLHFADGTPVRTAEQWPKRRQEILESWR